MSFEQIHAPRFNAGFSAQSIRSGYPSDYYHPHIFRRAAVRAAFAPPAVPWALGGSGNLTILPQCWSPGVHFQRLCYHSRFPDPYTT